MIDGGFDWINAMWRLRPRPDAIVLAHAHPDHAWGFGRGAPCPVYATQQAWRGLTAFPISDKHVVRHRRLFELEGIVREAFGVEHSILAPAVGYRISAGRTSVFYVPDVVFIRQCRPALSGVTLYIGDGATSRRHWFGVGKRG
jgi:phosphoribosyl 1,2-cyclic phosphodiesterase